MKEAQRRWPVIEPWERLLDRTGWESRYHEDRTGEAEATQKIMASFGGLTFVLLSCRRYSERIFMFDLNLNTFSEFIKLPLSLF